MIHNDKIFFLLLLLFFFTKNLIGDIGEYVLNIFVRLDESKLLLLLLLKFEIFISSFFGMNGFFVFGSNIKFSITFSISFKFNLLP